MKKYITLAALLAAGTAFANATEAKTLVEWDFTGENPLNATVGTGGMQAYGLTYEVEQGNLIVKSDATNDAGSGFYSSSGANRAIFQDTTLTNWTLSFTATLDAGATCYHILQFGGTDFQDNKSPFSFYMGNGANDRGHFGFQFSTGERFGVTNLPGGLSSQGYDNVSATYVISMVNDTLSLSVNGVDLTNNIQLVSGGSEGDTLSSVYQESIHKGIAFTKLGYANEAGDNAQSDVPVNTVFSNIKITTAVPEPSAFGMLAGLAALALVASRRRRR